MLILCKKHKFELISEIVRGKGNRYKFGIPCIEHSYGVMCKDLKSQTALRVNVHIKYIFKFKFNLIFFVRICHGDILPVNV